MTLDELRAFFLWCAVLNYALLLYWFAVFVLARNWIRGLHRKWFKMSDETFDAIHYGGMAVYKIGIFLLNLMPYVALRIVG